MMQGLEFKYADCLLTFDAYLFSCLRIPFSPGNDRFVEISELNADQIADSLTVFNLVQPEYIPRLFDLFGLALRGGSPPPLVLLQSPLAPGNMLGLVNSTSSSSRARSTMTDEGDDAVASSIEGSSLCGNDDSSSGESRSTIVSSSEEEGGEEDRNHGEKEEVEEEEEKEYHHACMTVPCAHFPSAKDALFIMTVSALAIF